MSMTYFTYPSGAGSMSAYAQKLIGLLLAAGWDLVHADANAIGTGTASSPKFDTVAAAANAAAGTVAVRMPLAGLNNRWIIQIVFFWGSGTTVLNIRTTTAKAADAGTGALTSPGTTYGLTVGAAYTNNESSLAVSEYGFVAVNSGMWHGVERRRTVTNTWEDDVLTHQHSNGTPIGFLAGGWNRARSWATEEYAVMALAYLQGLNGGSVLDITTLSSAMNVGYPTGPYVTSNGLGGLLRHLITMRPADSVAGVDQGVEVSGVTRIYAPMMGAIGNAPGGNRILLAKE